MMKIVLLGIWGLVDGVETKWGKYPLPRSLGLYQLVGQLQADDSTSTTTLSVTDQINAIIAEAAQSIANSQQVVTAQLKELSVTEQMVNQTVDQMETNEDARVSLIKQYNNNAMSMNQNLVDMTTGSQAINNVISVSNRVKTNLVSDINTLNNAIMVVNDWMVKMDAWVVFVTDETNQIDGAQASLLDWGEATKNNINTHEVSAMKLAREAYDIETQISQMNNLLLGTGRLLNYVPTTLTMPQASGGLGDSLWS
jgi:hypothetical protein